MSASPFFSAGGPHGAGVDIILARLDSQDRAVEAVRKLAEQTLAEARQTNGRVRLLETWVAHHDGVQEAEMSHEEAEELEAAAARAARRERIRWWAERAAALLVGVGIAVIANLLIGGSP